MLLEARKRLLSVDEIVHRYRSGESTEKIAEDAGISRQQVWKILKANGIQIRRGNGKPPRYKINVDFFKTWSPRMAYVLGFILTDGCVSHNTVSISQKDRYILDRIAEVLETDYPIVKRRNNKDSYIYYLNISRKEIVQDLRKYGVVPNKSRVVEFPDTPDDCLPHLLRGIIDGDGNVRQKGYGVRITTASFKFANGLFDVFNKRGYKTRITFEKSKNGPVFNVWVSGREHVVDLGKWIYQDCGNLFVPSKRAKIERVDVSKYLPVEKGGEVVETA